MAKYTNSPLVSYTKLSPNHSGKRTHSIDRISPHCVVGQCSAERIGEIFAPTSRQASSNYGIGYDGRVGLYVEEKNRSWCTSSNANDQRAITIEVASDTTHPYAMRDAAYNKLVDLCVDICQRNGKKKLLWFADKNKTLAYEPAADEMIITVHRWFANKACPGDWLYSRLGDLATTVTKRLRPSSNASTRPSKTDVVTISKGDTVMVKSGAKTYTGGKLSPFVYKTKYKVLEKPKGNRVVIGLNGQVTAAVNAKDLRVVKKASGTSVSVKPASPKGTKFHKGDKVTVNKGAKTYTGRALASFVYNTTYTVVEEPKEDRVVIGINGTVTAAVNAKDLKHK